VIVRLGSALRRAARIAFERPRATAWALVAVTCALFALGAAAVAADNVDRWANAPRGVGASMVIYLGEGTDETSAHQLAGELARVPGVEHVELVPSVETARRLQQALGADSALLDGVDLASLPPSLEVSLAPGMRDVLEMSPTMRALRAAPGVNDIAVEAGDTDRGPGSLGTVSTLAWIAVAAFGGLVLVVVLAAVRLRFERGREELAVARLLGASPAFCFVPTALAGALYGLVSAVVAAIAIAIVVACYGDAITRGLAGSLDAVELALPALPELALFVALGAALGMLGGGLAGASRAAN
jgi:cell division transport system permease protein